MSARPPLRADARSALGANVLRVPARDLRPGDVALASRQRILHIISAGPGTGKMCLTLELLAGPRAGTMRSAEWNRGTIINIHRPR